MKAFYIQTNRLAVLCILQVFVVVGAVIPTHAAGGKITANLRSNEGMKFHDNPSPRRLMHDVLLDEFAHDGKINIVNKENTPDPVKHLPTPYYVGANLIAFEISAKDPVQLSISIALTKHDIKRVVVMESKALMIPKADVDSGLKLKDREFDNSKYGKAVIQLTRAAAKEFSEKVKQSGYED